MGIKFSHATICRHHLNSDILKDETFCSLSSGSSSFPASSSPAPAGCSTTGCSATGSSSFGALLKWCESHEKAAPKSPLQTTESLSVSPKTLLPFLLLTRRAMQIADCHRSLSTFVTVIPCAWKWQYICNLNFKLNFRSLLLWWIRLHTKVSDLKFIFKWTFASSFSKSKCLHTCTITHARTHNCSNYLLRLLPKTFKVKEALCIDTHHRFVVHDDVNAEWVRIHHNCCVTKGHRHAVTVA